MAPLAVDLGADKGVTELCTARFKRREIAVLKALVHDSFWYSYVMPGGEEVRVPLGGNETMLYGHKTFHVFVDERLKTQDLKEAAEHGDEEHRTGALREQPRYVKKIAVVPSVLVPLKEDSEFRMTYDVIHYPYQEWPTNSRNLILLYNSFCVLALLAALATALRAELLRNPMKHFDPRQGLKRQEVLAVLVGTGTQLILAFAIVCLLGQLNLLLFGAQPFGVYAWLWAFTIAQVTNGFSVFRLFRLYRITQRVSAVVFAALLAVPLVCVVAIWQLNDIYGAIQSSRNISNLRLLLKTVLYIGLLLVPCHYLGALLSQQFSRTRDFKEPILHVTVDNLAPQSIRTAFVGLAGVFTFGASLPLLREFYDTAFGYRTEAPNPVVVFLSLIACIGVTACVSIACIQIYLQFKNPEWTSVPVYLGAGTAVAVMLYTLCWNIFSIELTLTNFIEYIVLSLFVGASASAVSYYTGEVYTSFLETDLSE
ncbi:endomembrane protein 70 [Gregarina niphandrodes]|uniref:Transmembrane 9 superfamily member n=1 Tax=Gregarina niphandrodes TaxID=110365 RepID=A0A023BDC2_GRENI|nr:endomembrane protein 70 [Gregarina niphandrodes]EZG88193.1 endomembrane protein 70 [Gregarina niphandrodes]|eukprot:XP_011128617.1 endomembrane protein 70 [Gregarina niphandrodes]